MNDGRVMLGDRVGCSPRTPAVAQIVGGERDGLPLAFEEGARAINMPRRVMPMDWSAELDDVGPAFAVDAYRLIRWRPCWDAEPVYRAVRSDLVDALAPPA